MAKRADERERALSDLGRIFSDARIWSTLGWVDIRSKYRLSSLGTFWITAAMGVLAVSIGLLYGQFFNKDVSSYLPYFASGFIIWTFVSATVTEASTSLIAYYASPINSSSFLVTTFSLLSVFGFTTNGSLKSVHCSPWLACC